MNRTDLVVGGGFLALAGSIAAGAMELPDGIGNVPGPAFFPLVIAAVMGLLGGLLLAQARKGGEGGAGAADWSRTLGAAALTFLYLALWGTGLFPLRTAVFLALLLRFLGESWKASAGVAATLTAVVFLAFQVGLSVSLE